MIFNVTVAPLTLPSRIKVKYTIRHNVVLKNCYTLFVVVGISAWKATLMIIIQPSTQSTVARLLKEPCMPITAVNTKTKKNYETEFTAFKGRLKY